jgi:hypothetical protein
MPRLFRQSGGRSGRALPMLLGMAAIVSAPAAHAVTILPKFASNITKASNAAAIEAMINSSVQVYGDFGNTAQVKIIYKLSNSGLGGSETTLYYTNYSGYTNLLSADLASHPTNQALASGLANLGSANQAGLIVASSANFRALGVVAPGLFRPNGSFNTGGNYDAIVFLNAGIMSFTNTVASNQYGAEAVIQHETDEVLGIGGGGSEVGLPLGPTLAGQSYIGNLDLYRYAAPGTPSFATGTSVSAYFSIDGGQTDLIAFNQNGQGDYGDWAKSFCGGVQNVQDWAACPGVPQFGLTVGSPEFTALQAVGYNLNPGVAASGTISGSIAGGSGGQAAAVPEPAVWTMMLGGVAALGAALRRQRRTRLATA